MSEKFINYKKRSLLLVFLFIILMFLTYSLGIKKTLDISNETNRIELNIEKARNAPAKISKITQELDFWDEEMVATDDSKELQVLLFNELNVVCKNKKTKLIGAQKIKVKSDNDLAVETYEVNMKGLYKNLVQALYELENQLKYGNVSSAKFELVKNRKLRIKELVLTLYIQSVVKVDV